MFSVQLLEQSGILKTIIVCVQETYLIIFGEEQHSVRTPPLLWLHCILIARGEPLVQYRISHLAEHIRLILMQLH